MVYTYSIFLVFTNSTGPLANSDSGIGNTNGKSRSDLVKSFEKLLNLSALKLV